MSFLVVGKNDTILARSARPRPRGLQLHTIIKVLATLAVVFVSSSSSCSRRSVAVVVTTLAPVFVSTSTTTTSRLLRSSLLSQSSFTRLSLLTTVSHHPVITGQYHPTLEDRYYSSSYSNSYYHSSYSTNYENCMIANIVIKVKQIN